MRNVATMPVKDIEEALRVVYAFMQTKQLNIKECSFSNPNPTKFDSKYIVPRDAYTAVYKDTNMPTWESFRTNKVHLSSNGFSCVACLDKKDKERVVCAFLGGVILFNCYGDYEIKAKKALEDIISISKNLA